MARPTQITKTVIDPMFQPPRGSEDNFTPTNPAAIRNLGDQSQVSTGLPGTIPVELTGDGSQTYLEAPDAFYIIDQTLRIGPGGQQVVDIVISCEEIIGAMEYEVQIDKV